MRMPLKDDDEVASLPGGIGRERGRERVVVDDAMRI
jgi:hypothetical protein